VRYRFWLLIGAIFLLIFFSQHLVAMLPTPDGSDRRSGTDLELGAIGKKPLLEREIQQGNAGCLSIRCSRVRCPQDPERVEEHWRIGIVCVTVLVLGGLFIAALASPDGDLPELATPTIPDILANISGNGSG